VGQYNDSNERFEKNPSCAVSVTIAPSNTNYVLDGLAVARSTNKLLDL